ncbi:MAG: rhomboid family intramembrane serine protease [Pseudomonadota bacterium]
MFPLRDHNPSEKTPFVTWALIAINVVIFLSYYGLFSQPGQLQAFFLTWGIVPARLSFGSGYETLVTSMFLHGGWLHLGGNMLFLWIFGDNLEEEFGHIGYLIFYLACGIGAGLSHVFIDPASRIPTVGASGAIAGVMGGYLLLFPKARVDILFIFIIIIRIIPVPAWVMLGLWFVIQFVGGVESDSSGGGVAYWAHAGGFVIGFVLTIPLWLRRGATAYWQKTDGHPPHPDAQYRLARSSIPSSGRRQMPDGTRRRPGPWSGRGR